MKTKTSITGHAWLALALAAAATGADAQTRWVFVNGNRLDDAQVAWFDRVQCTPIPNGSYWLNARTGAWGYAGNPAVQGFLGDPCRARAARPGLSQRGMLFRPGEILNGR